MKTRYLPTVNYILNNLIIVIFKKEDFNINKYLLTFWTNKNKPPTIFIQYQQSGYSMVFSPALGYDLCDFVELEYSEYGLKSKYYGNYFKGYKGNYHTFEIIQNDEDPISYNTYEYTCHPFFDFALFDDNSNFSNDTFKEDQITILENMNVCLAFSELSQFFKLSDIEGLTYEFFLKFIQRRILLPKVSYGVVPIMGQITNIKDSLYIGYDETLKLRREELLNSNLANDIIYYYCDNLIDIVFSYTYHILKLGYSFKKCKNCGKWFVPLLRSDTLYCERFSPQDKNKTCKKYATEQTYKEKLENDKVRLLYRKNYQRLQTNAKRYHDIEFHVQQFEEYKSLSKKYIAKVKNNQISQEEYYQWLKKYDNRRTAKEES